MKISKFLTGLLATLASASVFAVPVSLIIEFDNFPNETAFGMWDAGSAPSAAAYAGDPGLALDGIAYDVGASSPIGFGDGFVLPGDFTGEPAGVPFNFEWDLSAGDYAFAIYDSFGDGICCGFGAGTYTLNWGTGSYTGGEFASDEGAAVEFTLFGIDDEDSEDDGGTGDNGGDNGTAIPEPGILTLLGLGLIGMFGARRRRV